MVSKTHQTAVAVVPPQEVWGPIQAIRERHDRQFRRWMPHVNLLYPFYPPEQFDQIVPDLIRARARITPFVVTLAEFRFFVHPSGKATLWLAPEPREEFVRLQAALQQACQDCDDLSRFSAGFTPHLSVGQAGSAQEAQQLRSVWQLTWEPIRFELSDIVLLRRGGDTPFEIDCRIPLAVSSPRAGPVGSP
jgi:2'-5' RNA ligase